MNIMPNEYEKDCDNDASNGTTTYFSGLVMKSIDFLKSPSLLISGSSGGPTPKKNSELDLWASLRRA